MIVFVTSREIICLPLYIYTTDAIWKRINPTVISFINWPIFQNKLRVTSLKSSFTVLIYFYETGERTLDIWTSLLPAKGVVKVNFSVIPVCLSMVGGRFLYRPPTQPPPLYSVQAPAPPARGSRPACHVQGHSSRSHVQGLGPIPLQTCSNVFNLDLTTQRGHPFPGLVHHVACTVRKVSGWHSTGIPSCYCSLRFRNHFTHDKGDCNVNLSILNDPLTARYIVQEKGEADNGNPLCFHEHTRPYCDHTIKVSFTYKWYPLPKAKPSMRKPEHKVSLTIKNTVNGKMTEMFRNFGQLLKTQGVKPLRIIIVTL